MQTNLAALAALVDGTLVGDGTLAITGAAALLDSGPGDITLLDREKGDRLASCAATAAIVPAKFQSDSLSMPVIRVDDVHKAFTTIVAHFRPPRKHPRVGISPAAFVDASAKLGADVDVHPGASIGRDVVIGSGSTIHSGARIMDGCQLAERVTVYPNAVIYENTRIGPRSIIHANVVLGCHGFGYRFFEGSHQPAAQLGHVQIGADCEIGAGSTVDRGTYGPTIIGDGTKIDNLVMIAHNCRIGRHNMICSQVGVAGSSITGDYVVMAGQVGVRDHIRVGDRAVLGAKAGVSHDVPADTKVFGIPAIEEREQKVQFAALARLPEMRKKLKALQHAVDQLSREQGNASDAA